MSGAKPQSAHITTDSLKVRIRTTELKLNRDVVGVMKTVYLG